MDNSQFTELRRLVGQHEKIVFEAVKMGKVAELPHESQLYARAIQEHMHLGTFTMSLSSQTCVKERPMRSR